jgi:hypothetical protein
LVSPAPDPVSAPDAPGGFTSQALGVYDTVMRTKIPRGRGWRGLALVALGTLLASCDREPSGVPARPPATTQATGTAQLAGTLVDGFEAESLAPFWLPGDYGTGSHRQGGIVLSTDYARSGRKSARITVNEGDVEAHGDDDKRVERSELDSGHYALLGRDVWYGFSFLLPKDFPVVDDRLVIASVKQSDVEGSPLIGQRFRAGRHTLTIRAPGMDGGGRSHAMPDIQLGRWHDMAYHVRYATGGEGRIEIWMDGKRVVHYEGPTASATAANRFYHKVGLYRDRWKESMTMYVDNYTVGDSFKAVDPSTFDERNAK